MTEDDQTNDKQKSDTAEVPLQNSTGSIDGKGGDEDVFRSKIFHVSLATPEDPTDLVFTAQGSPMPQEVELKSDIENCVVVLKSLFPKWDKGDPDQRRALSAYITKLFIVAQTGLERDADFKVATLDLLAFKNAVRLQEGPRVKNKYMKRLGVWAVALTLLGLLIYTGIETFVLYFPDTALASSPYKDVAILFLLWSAAMVGSWLSFGIRRVDMTFEDLGRPEVDMVTPGLRLIFTGLLSLTLSLVFVTEMVQVSIGSLDTKNLLVDPFTAVLIGLFCGIGEQALTTTVGGRATQFIGEAAK
ncbi:MAG: hypothetical protein NVSMB6_18480 [Burkholderiaceae bacterium]